MINDIGLRDGGAEAIGGGDIPFDDADAERSEPIDALPRRARQATSSPAATSACANCPPMKPVCAGDKGPGHGSLHPIQAEGNPVRRHG